jgi:hypothetical protein
MGQFQNRSSAVHPKANQTDASLIDDSPVPVFDSCAAAKSGYSSTSSARATNWAKCASIASLLDLQSEQCQSRKPGSPTRSSSSSTLVHVPRNRGKPVLTQLPSQILRQKYSHLSLRIFGCLCMVLDQMAKHHSAGLEDLDVKGMVCARDR